VEPGSSRVPLLFLEKILNPKGEIEKSLHILGESLIHWETAQNISIFAHYQYYIAQKIRKWLIRLRHDRRNEGRNIA
jgi:hypothetical protein